MQVSEGRAVARSVVAVARERQVTVTAAGLAYHAFNALIPLLLLGFVGLSVAEEFGVVARLLEAATGAGAAQTERLLRGLTGNGASRGRAVVIAALILGWSAVRMFQAVHRAFGDVYGTRKQGSPLERVRDVLLVLTTLSLALALMAVVGVALSFAFDGWGWRLFTPPLLFLALLAVFVPMYYVFPRVDVTVGEVLPGAVLAAAAWTASALLFRAYAATSESVQLYGVAGAVLLLLTWMYVGGLVLLVGAVLNAVLANRVTADDDWIPDASLVGSD